MKRKTVFWTVVLLISHSAVFIAGSMTGRQLTTEYFVQAYESANAHVLMAHYSSYKRITSNIKASQSSKAQCEAEMMATAMFDSVRVCVADAKCKEAVTEKAREFSPEILGEAPLPFERRTSCPF